MRFNIFVSIIILTITTFFVGCTGTTDAPTNSAKPATTNSNSITGTVNSNNPLGTTKIKPEAETANNAPTLTPIVQGYYAALQKKDEAGVKKFLSQSAQSYWANEMKSEKKNSLVAILEKNESPIEEKREVRNERIEGDSAVAEMKGGSLGTWTPVKFVRENGEWKFASPEESIKLQDIPKTS